MTLTFNQDKYKELLTTYIPKLIKTEAENKQALAIVENLMYRGISALLSFKMFINTGKVGKPYFSSARAAYALIRLGILVSADLYFQARNSKSCPRRLRTGGAEPNGTLVTAVFR